MRKTFMPYIKLTLALVLLLKVGAASAQTKIEYTSGANTPFAGGTINIPASLNNTDIYFGCPELDNLSPWLVKNHYAQVNFTNPALKVVVEFWGADSDDEIHLDVNGVSYAITPSMISCGPVTCTTYNQCNTPVYSSNGNVLSLGSNAHRLTITGTYINNFRISLVTGSSGFGLSNFTFTPCGGGAPTLSATTINNSSCASPYINLNSLITSTTPTGTTLKWYTSTARTTEVTDPTTVSTSGTYFAFYYDGTNNCFSPASAGVTATYTVCPLNIATVCPAITLDLASSIIDAAPTGYTYTYHSATPATTANKLSSSVVSTSGTYYVALYFASRDCYTDTSIPMVVTIVDCCATQVPPTFN